MAAIGNVKVIQQGANRYSRVFDPDTGETLYVEAPVWYKQDFFDSSLGSFGVKTIGSPTTNGILTANAHTTTSALAATSENEDALIYCSDRLFLDVSKIDGIEFRINISTLPTGLAIAYFGLMSAWNASVDSVSYQALFSLRGDGVIKCESDDNATDVAPVTSGVTAVAGTSFIARISFSDLTSLRFTINENRVCNTTTFPFAATGSNLLLQPCWGLQKASGTGVGAVVCDYVSWWGNR